MHSLQYPSKYYEDAAGYCTPHLGAAPRELPGGGLPDAGVGARDDDRLAFRRHAAVERLPAVSVPVLQYKDNEKKLS